MQVIRTNNECEGWHNRFNSAAQGKANLDLCVLIPLMQEEALTIPLTRQLVDEEKILCY